MHFSNEYATKSEICWARDIFISMVPFSIFEIPSSLLVAALLLDFARTSK